MTTTEQIFHYKNNRLQQLRGFCYTAQFSNISHAATHMGLTHSAVSLQIKSLEEDLGVKLFTRNGPQIKLTNEGNKLLQISLPIIDDIENLPHIFRTELENTKRTELHIAANSTTLNFILPSITKDYLATNPDIHLTVHYAEHNEAMEKLIKGEVDVAILPKREHIPFPKECEYLPMFYYTPSLITRADHPLAGRKNLSVQEISNYELTLPAEELRVISNLYNIFPKHNINKKLRINFINWETTRKYIEAGLVISISSDVIVEKNDVLVATPLSHLFPMVDYGFVVKRGKKLPDKVLHLIDTAKLYATEQKKHK